VDSPSRCSPFASPPVFPALHYLLAPPRPSSPLPNHPYLRAVLPHQSSLSYPTFPAQVRFFFLILAGLCFLLEAILAERCSLRQSVSRHRGPRMNPAHAAMHQDPVVRLLWSSEVHPVDVTTGCTYSRRVMLGAAVLPRKWLAHGPSQDADKFS